MKIHILISKFLPQWVGGTETQINSMAAELAKKDHDVTLITRHCPGSSTPKYENKGFKIKRFFYINKPIIRYLMQFTSFLNDIRKNRKNIDVLLCMQLTPNGFIGCVAKKLFGLPVISYIRGGDWYFNQEGFGRVLISYVLKNSDMILAQTENIRKDVLRQFPETNIKVIPNGLYPCKTKSKGKDIVFVGNLSERKGVKYLIPAMKRVDEKLIIAGDGQLRNELKKQAGNQCVEFIGNVPNENVRDFMSNNGKIIVLPAIVGEGLPNVILEAMSVGIPVVATKIAGIPDVVKNGETGLLVEPKDIEGLRNAILKLSKDEKLRKKMGNNCLKEIKKYYWDDVIKQLEVTINL